MYGHSGEETLSCRKDETYIRYFWVKEKVDSGEAVVEHLGTESMYANVLTKSLQGAQYDREVKMLTGW